MPVDIQDMVDRWFTHCAQRGDEDHRPVSDGGKAEYTRSPQWTVIHCAVPGCTWDYCDEVALAELS